jgi:hypothetical protein
MTLPKYGLHTVEYSVQGWDAIMSADMTILDGAVHTNIQVTLGETVAQYEAVGIFSGETKYKLAKSGGKLQPCLGLALVAGVLDDQINIQRVGPITNSGWALVPGKPVFLSPITAGAITQSPSGTTQMLGMAITTTTFILSGTYDYGSLPSTTTTTSTTSSTTTTTA